MRCDNIAVPLIGKSKHLKRRCTVNRPPGVVDRRNTSAVRCDRAEQLHHEHLERRVGRAVRGIRIPRHRLLERGANVGITAILAEARHDAEDRIAPLAERDEVMEAFKDNVLLAEMRAFPGILEPIPGDRPLRISDAPVRDIVQPLIDPGLKEIQERPHRHVVVVHDWLRRVAESKNGVEALADRADLRRNCFTLYPEVQVPIDVPVIVEIMPHERLAGMLRI